MDVQQIADGVVKLIREGKNKQAKDQYYSSDIVSIEGNGDKLVGIQAVYRKSADWSAQFAAVHSAFVSEPLVAAGYFSLHIKMDISYSNGRRALLDEIAVYEVNAGKIVFEQYFFKA